MNELARYNRERWNELARSGVEFSRPWLSLDQQQARAEVDPFGFIGEAAGKEVIWLRKGA